MAIRSAGFAGPTNENVAKADKVALIFDASKNITNELPDVGDAENIQRLDELQTRIRTTRIRIMALPCWEPGF